MILAVSSRNDGIRERAGSQWICMSFHEGRESKQVVMRGANGKKGRRLAALIGVELEILVLYSIRIGRFLASFLLPP